MNDTTHDIAGLLERLKKVQLYMEDGGLTDLPYEAAATLAALQAERDALQARGDAALARAYMAGRDDAANEVRDEYDLEAIRALTPPADLAARIAAMKGPGHE